MNSYLKWQFVLYLLFASFWLAAQVEEELSPEEIEELMADIQAADFEMPYNRIISGIPEVVQKSSVMFYVPYNDHGKWGWCDTLGNITIAPVFQKTDFFHPHELDDGSYDFIAEVYTLAGRNYYSLADGLIHPKKHGLFRQGYSFNDSISTDSYDIIQDRKGRYGLKSEDRGILINPKYDSLDLEALSRKTILLKKSGRDTWFRFNPNINKLVPTDISGGTVYTVTPSGSRWSNNIYVLKHKDGRFSIPGQEWELKPFIFEKDFIYETDVQFVSSVPGTGASYVGLSTSLPVPADGIVEEIDFSKLSTAVFQFGFQELTIFRKGGKLGIVNEKGEDYLPTIYDKIVMSYSGASAELYQNEMVGRKNFFTHYPTIRARYNHLAFVFILRSNGGPQFQVYKVWLPNDHQGYVGENGIEYFSFD